MQITIDIEVVPNLDDAAITEIAAGIQAPGNYKKPESIAEWMAENKARLVDEQVHKAGLDGATGKIICIGWAWGMEAIINATGDEDIILAALFADITNRGLTAPADVIGHNVSWDLRYIWQRAVVNGIKPPWQIKWHGKPWDHIDTMRMWNDDSQRKISLDKLCKVLDVPTSKGDMDGSKVWQAYKDGRIDDIAAYCMADVEATRQCWKRMTFQ